MKEQINKNYENLREGKEAYEAPQCEIIELDNYENLREGKEAYEAPQCEIIELDAEFNLLLTDSDQQNPGWGRSTDSYGW